MEKFIMVKNMDKVVRRTYRYFYDEGLVEMALGLIFIAVGIWLVIWDGLTAGALSGLFLAVGLPLLIFGSAVFFKQLIKKLKERITYPRTGYVSYRQDQPDRGRWLFIGTAALFTLLAIFLPDSFNQMSVMVGALLGVILIYMGYRVEVRRFYLIGVISIILGFGLAQLGINEVIALGLLFTAVGVVLLLSGAITLIFYLRSHPEQQETMMGEGS
jgi:MFS family permease